MVATTSTVRRFMSMIPTALAASFIVFVLVWIGPNPVQTMLNEGNLDPAAAQQMQKSYGLDRPWSEQYLSWLSDFASGHLGTSMRTNEPAGALIMDRLGVTLTIAGAALALSILISIPLAMFMAERPRSTSDTSLTAGAVIISALPAFLLALLLQYLAVVIKDVTGITVFHASGGLRNDGLIEILQRYTLPIATLTAVQVAGWMRYQRGLILDVIGSEYIIAARARGIPLGAIRLRHVLRSALTPVITLIAIDLGLIIGGTLIVETVFGLPGTGRLLLDSVQAHDTVVALDLIMIGALAIVLANLVADLICDRIDPRRNRA